MAVSEPQRWYQPANVIILTGAGFTKTFGGYLGRTMWSEIFNQVEIQNDSRLRDHMLSAESFSFETFYDEVMESETYFPEQKSSVTSAVRRVYKQMDERICYQSGAGGRSCRFFLARFAHTISRQERAFFFTLNQDLFNERFYTEFGGDLQTRMTLPGLQQRAEWFKGDVGFEPVGDQRTMLPDDIKVRKFAEDFWKKGRWSQFVYIKLHGSYGWQSSDGTDVMVIGHGKRGKMEKEPLLRWYLSLFEEVLGGRKGRKLVVIGYGFRDEHINEVIAKAVEHSGLELYAIYPITQEQFRDQVVRAGMPVQGTNVIPDPDGRKIWRGLRGYEECTAKDMYSDSSTHLTPRGEAFLERLGI